MKCIECGADIFDGVKKCPYCKTLTVNATENEKFKDFDIKYTITSEEQVRKIQETAKGPKKNALEKYLAERRAAKRAARRAARRGEPVPKKLSGRKQAAMQIEENPFLRDTAVPETGDESVKTYTRVPKTTESREMKSKKTKPQFKSFDLKSIKLQFLMKNVALVGGAAVVLALAVVLVVALASAFSSDKKIASYTYAKDNSMYMVYKGKNLLISEKVIEDNYVRKVDADEGTLISAERAAKNAGIVHSSKDGKTTFFFEDYDPETNSGRLRLIKNGKIKKIKTISDAVHNSIVMTKDGEKLLFLQTADKNGDMGVLYYWEMGMEDPFKVATDIDHDTFEFSEDGKWAIFLQNLNRVEMRGDMYAKNLAKLKDEKVKLDSNVCKLFGPSNDGDSHLYAKDFDTNDSSFDIYAINKKNRILRLGERTIKNPVIQRKKNNIFILGLADDGTGNLYNVNVDSGKKEKIATGVNNVLLMSEDEKTVIYDKVYSEKIADYYAYTRGKQPVKIAGNIVVDYNIVGTNPQMACTKDAGKILYISEFEAFKGGGKLMLCEYKKGRIVSDELVAEDVYSCFRAEDGNFVFTKEYSPSRKVFDVYLFDGKDQKLLKEEVAPEMFGVSKSGDDIYYVSNYNIEGSYGTLERMDTKGNSEELASEVFGFSISSFEDIMFYRNLNADNGSFDMCLIEDEKSNWKEINTAVNEILTF